MVKLYTLNIKGIENEPLPDSLVYDAVPARTNSKVLNIRVLLIVITTYDRHLYNLYTIATPISSVKLN